MDNVNALIDALGDLLERERVSLLRGEFEDLEVFFARKETLVQDLGEVATLPPDMLRPLQDKLKRNQNLMDSALDGIRAGVRRLDEVTRIRTTLRTYDRKGAIRDIDAHPGTNLERRA